MVLVIGLFILVSLIYGFFTSFNNTLFTNNLEYIFTHVLAVLGFGLLLVHFKLGIQQTLIIALLVCFVNLLMGPMVQQFWYNVFTRGFQTSPNDQTLNLNRDSATEGINNVTLGFARISTYCSISVLVALTAVIGRIGLINTFIATVIFNIGWNLSYYLNFHIFFRADITERIIMDDLNGSRVFAFGAGFAITLFLLYQRFAPVRRNANINYTDQFTTMLTLLGSIFTLSFFYFVLDTYTTGNKGYALLNIYFAFSTSIVTSVAVCLIISGIVTLQMVNMAFISGAIQISIIATFIRTPYVAMLVGALAGVVTSLLFIFWFNKVNRDYFRDSKGLLFVYLINVLLCAFFVSPIIIKAYENY